jgi:hypothetical protein
MRVDAYKCDECKKVLSDEAINNKHLYINRDAIKLAYCDDNVWDSISIGTKSFNKYNRVLHFCCFTCFTKFYTKVLHSIDKIVIGDVIL